MFCDAKVKSFFVISKLSLEKLQNYVSFTRSSLFFSLTCGLLRCFSCVLDAFQTASDVKKRHGRRLSVGSPALLSDVSSM